MPPARKPAPAPPIQTYGCSVAGQDQLFYDRYAFAFKVPLDKGAPTRIDLFKRVTDKIVPGWFEWHSWTNRMIAGLCENQWVGLSGCSGCVSGDTKLLNPITGEEPTFRELCESNTAPVVMTLHGPIQAEVPFVKGFEELYEIRLKNGASFCSTGEHLVLTSDSFLPVKQLSPGKTLFSYAPTLPQSILGNDLLNRARDVAGFQKIIEGSQCDCRFCYHSYGEQLHSTEVFAQSHFPLQSDVPTHRSLFPRGQQLEHIHGSWTFPLSKRGCDSRDTILDTLEQHHSGQETASHDGHLFQRFWQYPLRTPCYWPSLKQVLDSSHTQKCDVLQREDYLKVSLSEIVSIIAIGKQEFYDITVPSVEHYYAQGAIHHNSSKTRNVAGFACSWWLMYPEESSVTFCSTTIKSLRKRGWAEVQNFHTSVKGPRFGNFVDSRMMWQHNKGDDKHAILGIAVEDGATVKVADNIKGIHTKRQMIIIDEATAVPPAIFEACTNMWAYPKEFILVLMGNPRSRLDEFGKFCEPLNGWQSVSVETEEWDTKPQMNGNGGIVLRFDSHKSPNIMEGRIVSRHLPTKEKVEARRTRVGSENDPSYWSNDRGFWAPEGLTKTVFTESAIVQHGGYNKHTFTGRNFHIIGTLDPARTGGDRPTLRFGKLGETTSGEWGLEWMPPIVIPLDARSTKPIDYQLMDVVRRQCELFTHMGQEYSCPVENVGVDATGGGANLCDTLQAHWSPKIMRIIFSGSASEDACSFEDIRPANEVYKNKRVEMYFRSRNSLNSGQLKGIDIETAKELCSIEFDDSKPFMALMPKADYKLMFGQSPDFADSGVMLLEVARRKGFSLAPVGQTVHKHNEWNTQVQKTQDVYEEVAVSGYGEEQFDYEVI